MTRTLLEKAKALPAPKKLKRAIRDGELELTLAYCRGEISLRQYWLALGRHPFRTGSASHRVGSVLRHGIMSGQLQIKINHSKPHHEK